MQPDNQKILISHYPFAETVNRLQEAILNKDMTIFTIIDHQAMAKEAELTLQPATVIVFGNPKVGTPLMQQSPTLALKLPLKVLITEINQETQVIFETTQSLIANTNIDFAMVQNTLAKIETLIESTITAKS